MEGPVKLSGPLLLILTNLFWRSQAEFEADLNKGSPCYQMLQDGTDDLNKALRCMPPFQNVISNARVSVRPEEMTCGVAHQVEYCMQSGGYYRECQICDSTLPDKHHNASYLTDIHTDLNQTSWLSVTMNERVHERPVNLTVNLQKAYDITYVRLKFSSPRPESFAIYKKFRDNPWEEDPDPEGGWIPWQFYSASCRDMFDVPESTSIIQPTEEDDRYETRKLGEDRALCTSEFSDISPLTGGNVAFATLDGRPGAFNFDNNRELQHWVSATDIRVSLIRLNTFGDEVFMDPKVLKSYYYGITHFQVGGRCKCNGHSNVCIPKDPNDPNSRSICLCKHGTTGDNCETCLRDHWDRRWQRATSENANPCLPCECNNWSTECRFNEELYMKSRRGGECLNCGGNRDGAHCELCQDNHYISPVKDAQGRQPCLPCDCHPTGSTDLQCSSEGKCQCKPGVTGDKCDQCEANYWNFPDGASRGCETCECMVEGSLGNRPSCDTQTGDCLCKQNVEGQRCDRCKSGHFYIDLDNDFGCTPCFCYGHTAQCQMAPGYTQATITSDFSRGPDDWQTEEVGQAGSSLAQFDSFKKLITLQSGAQNSYFVAPLRFIGDQRASYNMELKFSLKIGPQDIGTRPSAEDLIIEGGGDIPQRISLPITAQNNPVPTKDMQEYSFKLHENTEFGWTPSLRPKNFIAVLSDITSIKIRGSYVVGGSGAIDEFILESAEEGGDGKTATWVERCSCPHGYRGQFCEKCQLGFYHENNGGPFARCIPCNCNGHSDYCNEETGVCDCSHNTGGDNCEICADGFYGDAILGTPDDCAVCPCPQVEVNGEFRAGKCYELEGHPESPICAECPTGRIGSRCELCEDGYFGDPEGLQGPRRECRKCECSRNIDPSAIGNCDRVTGECLRCIDDTDGWNCEKCKSGFFGDALAPRQIGDPKNCKTCQCFPVGTFMSAENQLPECNAFTGKCSCKENVVGHNCEECKNGYWNIMSEVGCDPCNCDTRGALNATCDVHLGQCSCQEGMEGLQCDRLKVDHFRLLGEQRGSPCDCDPSGSLSAQCDVTTGQCPCREKVEGRKCDTCMENTKTKSNDENQKVCEPCDDCYNLVQKDADSHRQRLARLEEILNQIAENPEPIGNDFEVKMKKLKVTIRNTLFDAKYQATPGASGSLRDRLEELDRRLQEVVEVVGAANTQLDDAQDQGEAASTNVGKAEEVINRARESLRNAKNLMDVDGKEALRKAQDIARGFGVGNAQMSGLASTARKLAESQFESASEIESIANQANDISTEAYNKARTALEDQMATANDIDLHQNSLRLMGTNLAQVSAQADETLKQAEEQYLKALTIYQSIFNLKVPVVETFEFSDEADKISKDAERIKADAQRLMEENDEILRSTQSQRFDMEAVVKNVMQQQQLLQSKLAGMKTNNEAAHKAVETGNEVLEKARKTLEILQDFENRVNENRAAAEEALNKMANIETTLRLATEDTASADQALHHTDTQSIKAYEIAVESKKTAEEASQNARRVNEESTKVLETAEKLNTDAESLKDKSDETLSGLDRKRTASSREAQTAADALKEANKAQSHSVEATEKVKQAKRELEEISQILSSVQIHDSNFLDDLERRLAAAERKYQEADLEEKLRQLEEAKQRQLERKAALKNEYDMVKGEFETIGNILQQLSEYKSCPNKKDPLLEV